MTLGIRNNNPLNIRRGKVLWKGEIPQTPSLSGEGRGAPAFCKFSSMEWGLRAAFCLLRTYRDKYHLNCIADIIRRWAPPSENDTKAYICNVCRWTGLGGMQRLTEADWPKLVQAMARQECGIVLPEETIEQGYKLYSGTDSDLNLNDNDNDNLNDNRAPRCHPRWGQGARSK